MNDKEIRYAEIAAEVFSRYGFRKTTMGDIAEKAGVSRQTLYATYANKEEILAGAIRLAHKKTIAEIEADWANLTSVADKLDSYFRLAVIDYYEKLRAMPDADELMTGVNETGMLELNSAIAKKRQMIAAVFEDYSEELARCDTTPDDLADFVMTSSTHFKFVAIDLDHLKTLLATLKRSVLGLLGEA